MPHQRLQAKSPSSKARRSAAAPPTGWHRWRCRLGHTLGNEASAAPAVKMSRAHGKKMKFRPTMRPTARMLYKSRSRCRRCCRAANVMRMRYLAGGLHPRSAMAPSAVALRHRLEGFLRGSTTDDGGARLFMTTSVSERGQQTRSAEAQRR